MSITVYHGSTERVEHPICKFGRANLDFGQGFYITDIKEQAREWALIMSGRRNGDAVINVYQLDRSAFLKEGCCKVFTAYDTEWLDFIVGSRQGRNPAAGYDYIEGGVANDRVIDTINLYMAGLMDRESALSRLSQHRPNNQICLLNQELTDKYLKYERTEIVR